MSVIEKTGSSRSGKIEQAPPARQVQERAHRHSLTTVQWAISMFCMFIGSLMLVAPDQFSGAFWIALRDVLPWVGSFWFLSGVAMIGVVALGMPRPWVVASYLVASIALLLNAVNGVLNQTWGAVVIYVVIAVGTALVPFIARVERRPNARYLFAIVFAATMAVYGTYVLLFPDQFSSPFYDSVRSYLSLYGAGFLIGGLFILFAQLGPALPVWLYRASHLPILAPCLAYGVMNSIPIGAWTGVMFYLGLAPLAASLPWTGAWLTRLDPRSFYVRLAFMLVVAAAVPLVAITGIMTAGQERQARAEVEADLEATATVLASDASHYLGSFRSAAIALAAYPGLLGLTPAAQHAILRNYNDVYPDAVGFITRDNLGRGIARSDDRPPDSLSGQEGFFQEFLRSRSPVIGTAFSPNFQQAIFTVTAPVTDDAGRLVGIVGIALESGRVAALLGQLPPAPGTRIYLVDAAGHAIAHPDQSLVASFVDLSRTPPVSKTLAASREQGIVSYQGPSGEVLAAYARVPGLGWSLVLERPASVALAAARSGRNEAFGLLLGAVFLAVAAGSLLARVMTRPLAALARAAGGLAVGDRAVPLPTSMTSEIQELVDTFGEMRGRLSAQASERELLLHAEQRRAAELNAANRQLDLANKELESFAYSVAHDLRSPVRHMSGFSQALLDEYAGKLDDQGRQYLEFVRAGSEKMGQLIDDLLSLTGVSRSELHKTDIDLAELARSAAAGLQREHPGRQVDLIIAPGMVARGDSRLLRLVVDNLLANAWKFTSRSENARVEFGVMEQATETVYYVRDNGSGFNQQYAHKLFRPFERLHDEAEFPGSGIGLATVERVVVRHGGRVWAEGEVGTGATVYFTLAEPGARRLSHATT